MDSYSSHREVEKVKPIPHAIWKFALPMRGRRAIQMPRGAVLLSVGVQGFHENPVIWARCRSDAAAPRVSRMLSVRVTGGSCPSEVGVFVGTFQINRGEYVGHVFDLGEIA